MASDDEREDALTAARAIVAARYPDCDVALLAGSVVRGEATPTSDLDLWMLTQRPEAPFRESFVAHGWPVEAFANSPRSWRRFIADETRERRPATAQMIAEGIVLRDRDGLAEALQAEARAVLEAGPPALTTSELEDRRYGLSDLLDDFEGAASLGEGLFVAQRLAEEAAGFVLAVAGRWAGKGKGLWRALARYDAEGAQRLAAALQAYAREQRKDALVAWVDAALEPTGGRLFEGYRREKDDVPVEVPDEVRDA